VVLIDTCIWITLYRKQGADLGQKVWALAADNQAAFCGQVWVEYMGGFRNDLERKRYEKAFRSFPWIPTDRHAYEKAADLLARHPRLVAGDAIIAATAILNRAPLLTIDKDFSVLGSEGLELF